MKFLQYFGKKDWWMWPEDEGSELTVYNVRGGHHDIDENSPMFMNGKVVEAKSWAELCRKEHYNPLSTDRITRDMWIDPNGIMYDCNKEGHEGMAYLILKIIYGYTDEDELDYASDDLVNYTWIKVNANSVLNREYIKMGMYDHMSPAQTCRYEQWRDKFNAAGPLSSNLGFR